MLSVELCLIPYLAHPKKEELNTSIASLLAKWAETLTTNREVERSTPGQDSLSFSNGEGHAAWPKPSRFVRLNDARHCVLPDIV